MAARSASRARKKNVNALVVRSWRSRSTAPPSPSVAPCIWRAENRNDKALPILRELSLHGDHDDSMWAYNRWAVTLAQSEGVDVGLRMLNQAIAQEPESVGAYDNRGSYLTNRGLGKITQPNYRAEMGVLTVGRPMSRRRIPIFKQVVAARIAAGLERLSRRQTDLCGINPYRLSRLQRLQHRRTVDLADRSPRAGRGPHHFGGNGIPVAASRGQPAAWRCGSRGYAHQSGPGELGRRAGATGPDQRDLTRRHWPVPPQTQRGPRSGGGTGASVSFYRSGRRTQHARRLLSLFDCHARVAELEKQ